MVFTLLQPNIDLTEYSSLHNSIVLTWRVINGVSMRLRIISDNHPLNTPWHWQSAGNSTKHCQLPSRVPVLLSVLRWTWILFLTQWES